jgi:acyl-CoA synthetase (AMP-forming)/AMP-acid ligase II
MNSVSNLAKNLTDTTRAHAGRVAVRVDNAAMTYRALDEASARVAELLHAPDRADYDTSSLRMCISGGAALPVEVLRGFEEALNVPVLEGYGLSETSPVASFNHIDRERKPARSARPSATWRCASWTKMITTSPRASWARS